MTKERAEKLLPIIKAYAEGKEIQVLTPSKGWDTITTPNFDDISCYRIKPEGKELKWTDLKIGDVIRNKELPFIRHLITGIDEGAGQVFFCDSWTKSEELEEWEKVE